MPSPRDLRLLTYFVQIVRAGSIRGAGDRLGLSPAVISEALSDLEAILGVTLINRTTRSMALTDTGAKMFEHASDMVAAADAALAVEGEASEPPSGRVRITLPAELSIAWLPAILHDFESRYPDVRVEPHADDARISLPTSDFDLAIRTTFSRKEENGDDVCACLPLELVCAPSLIGKRTETLERRLTRIGVVGASTARRSQRRIEAYPRTSGKSRKARPVAIEAPYRFVVNNQVVSHKLALEGFGAALMIGLSVEDDLAGGRLVRVDDDHTFGFVVARVMTRDRYPSRAVRALRGVLLP